MFFVQRSLIQASQRISIKINLGARNKIVGMALFESAKVVFKEL